MSVRTFTGFPGSWCSPAWLPAFSLPRSAGPARFPLHLDRSGSITTKSSTMTGHVQYQPWKVGPWVGFNWRYDSGLVAGPAPCAGGNCANGPAGTDTVVDTSGLKCGSTVLKRDCFADRFHRRYPPRRIRWVFRNPVRTNLCPASQYGSSLLQIPAPGTENDDHNPPRIAPRNLFDVSVGDDNLFKGDHYKWSLTLTAINITNKLALYNFLSTFSGTHYVTPRALTAQLGFHF